MPVYPGAQKSRFRSLTPISQIPPKTESLSGNLQRPGGRTPLGNLTRILPCRHQHALADEAGERSMNLFPGIVRAEIQRFTLNDWKPQIRVPTHVIDGHQN